MLRIFKKKRLIIPVVIIITVITLWVTGVVPSGICILTASRYVNEKYSERNFQYDFIEYSSAHSKYFVHFKDNEGKDIGVMTSIFGVDYDPLDPPG